ncbi:DUF4166 domain-containing protein [Gordonia sp. ABSL1-1]|uniref:DUF4166 domain-containing protein n=1 Tax=Gordonia sp. ABSL1-1 TaxID=3053923 RepID=UPI002573F09E|nr:DUF4166 domain-containing protein [Gordonia sp. ABSL1-1]MDL9936954.1 DUF4166 domain-containing protein [Gordonia sp. ABSL1-1]
MTPVYMDALGSDFDRLHPNLAWRYSIDSTSGVALTCSGIYESVYVNSIVPGFVLRYFGKRAALPTRSSRMVPFTEGHYCYRDELGRESLAVLRDFEYSTGSTKLNSVKVHTGGGQVIDYFGDGPELLFPLELSTNTRGDLIMESGPIKWLGRSAKIGMGAFVDARMKYMEGWDDRNDRFRCDATVRSPLIGEVLHFRGWFSAADRACALRDIPDEAWTENLVEHDA